jgi:xanthine/CO dehydrogenase XdhC/CoxF family maturation factor
MTAVCEMVTDVIHSTATGIVLLEVVKSRATRPRSAGAWIALEGSRNCGEKCKGSWFEGQLFANRVCNCC